MALIKNRVNPINIAPFVDILLILFVILVVAARFDSNQEANEYLNKKDMLYKQIKQLQDKVSLLDKAKQDLKSKNKQIEKLQNKIKNSKAKIADIQKLQDKIATLNLIIKKLKAKDVSNKKLDMKLLVAKKSFKNKEQELYKQLKQLQDKVSLLDKAKQDLKSKNKQIEKLQNKIKNSKAKIADIKKLQQNIKDLKAALKDTREDLLSYKKDKKRKNDLYITIDRVGTIWLTDGITRKMLTPISKEVYKSILSSLTFSNIKFFYFKDSKKSLQTTKWIEKNSQNF